MEEAGLNKWGRDFLRRFQPPPDEKEAQRGVRERRFGRNLLIMATIAIADYKLMTPATEIVRESLTTTDPGRWKIVMAPEDDLKKDVATVE